VSDPRTQSPFALPNYPYRDAGFTVEQVREALERKDRILELLMDPVGPDGCLMNLPIDMMHILAFHLAYAGADTHTDARQLIESRPVKVPDSMFEVYEWKPRGSFGDVVEAEPVDAAAADLAAQMKSQLTPQVRAALAQILIDESNAAKGR